MMIGPFAHIVTMVPGSSVIESEIFSEGFCTQPFASLKQIYTRVSPSNVYFRLIAAVGSAARPSRPSHCLGPTNPYPCSSLCYNLSCAHGCLGSTSSDLCSVLDHHPHLEQPLPLNLVSSSSSSAEPYPGTPCVRIDCMAPPDPACSNVLGSDGCPERDCVRVPVRWKPGMRSPGGWLPPSAPCHHRLLCNWASDCCPPSQLCLKGRAAQSKPPVCAPRPPDEPK
jgi:hypothetical protein